MRKKDAAQVEADKASLDQAKADYETGIVAARADVDGAKAAVPDAEIDLGYCRMFSPIDGRIGLAQVKLGNLVGPATGGGGSDYTELAIVQQLDPMGVDIQVSLPLPRPGHAADRAGALRSRSSGPGSRGRKPAAFRGKATVIDNTIDPTTSTFLVQAEVANPDEDAPARRVRQGRRQGRRGPGRGRRPRAGRDRDPGRSGRLHRRRAGQGGGRPRPGDHHLRGPPRHRIGPRTRPARDRRGAADGPPRA